MLPIGLTIFILAFFIFARPVAAVCPVCTVAIGTCVGLSRWLGVDDSISGIWIGGFILSTSFWIINWSKKKNINFPFKNLFSIVISYLITLLPLYFTKVIGHPYNTLWGFDKLIIGVIGGSLVFLFSLLIDRLLRLSNQGKVLFPYQKVVLPIIFLLLVSLFFYTKTCQ